MYFERRYIHGMENLEVTDQNEAPPSMVASLKSKVRGWVKTFSTLNHTISSSTFGRIFRLKGSGHVCSRCHLLAHPLCV